MPKLNKILAGGIITVLLVLNGSGFAGAAENSTSLSVAFEKESIWQRIKKDVKKTWEGLFRKEEDYRVKIPIPPPPPPPLGLFKKAPASNSTFWQWYQ